MKSARERAKEWIAHSFQNRTMKFAEAESVLELSFKEHARDQRHIDAETAQAAAGRNPHPFVRDFAPAVHHAVMNAPAPGG